MNAMASQIIGVSIVCSTVCSGADQRKHQSSASPDFARGIHRWPLNSPHKRTVTQKMSPFDYVIVECKWVVDTWFKGRMPEQYPQVNTSLTKCEIRSLIGSQTSTVQPLKFGMDKLFHYTLYWAWDYITMLGVKWIHVGKMSLWSTYPEMKKAIKYSVWVSGWVVEFNGLFGDSRHQGPYI